jgi:mannose-6-phosphate isomerase-like protein (cupin superfamily)
LHQHPDAAECWVILEGKWKWFIEGKGDMEVTKGSIINVPEKNFCN